MYGQASDQGAKTTKEQLRSENGVHLMINAIYGRDFMSVISEAYENFSALTNPRQEPPHSPKTFETRFLAAGAIFNSFSSIKKLLQCITSSMLLNNASIENSQRVSAHSAAALTGTAFPDQASNHDSLKVVTYSPRSSIVKHWGKSECMTAGTKTASSESGSFKRTFKSRGNSDNSNNQSLHSGVEAHALPSMRRA